MQKWPTLSGMGTGAVMLLFTTTGYIDGLPGSAIYPPWQWILATIFNVALGFALGYLGTIFVGRMFGYRGDE